MSKLHDWTLSEDARKAIRKSLPKYEDTYRADSEQTAMGTNTPSPPSGSDRACLCKNGKYSKDCCTGALWAQGI